MELLSGDAFKLWVRLCLNQNGQIRKLDADRYPGEFDELFRFGYLRSGSSCDTIFTDDATEPGEAERINLAWYDICTLYGKRLMDCSGDFAFVNRRLKEACLTDQAESILLYWKVQFDELSAVRDPDNQYPIRYDFTIVLSWYLSDHFLFEPGDVLFVGREGQSLHYSHPAVKAKVKGMLCSNHSEYLTISGQNVHFWIERYSARKIGIPPETIGGVLRARQERNQNIHHGWDHADTIPSP